MQTRITCSLQLHNCCKWMDCEMGKKQIIACMLQIPHRFKVEQSDALQVRLLASFFLEDGNHATLKMRSSGSSSGRNYQRTKVRPCRS